MTERDSSHSTPGVRPACWVLAVLLPLSVMGVAAAWFARMPDANRSKAAITYEARLEDQQPEVVIIGNSMARMGIDVDKLEETLNARVTTLATDSSSASIWYLILKNRVFSKGHRPHAVLVLGAARTLLANQPPPGRETINAADHREPVEPVVDAKLHGKSLAPIEWMWAKWRRDQLRTWILDGIRRTVVELFFGSRIAAAGTEDADTWAKEQLNAVFGGEDAMSDIVARRVIPVVDARTESAQTNPVTVEDSFFPDFVQIAKEHDARLVFVRMPMAPSGTRNLSLSGDVAYESTLREALDYLSGQDAAYVDMRNMGLSDADFVDYLHVNQKGRAKLTKALGEHLQQIDLMGNQPLPRVVNLSPGPLVRTGPLPASPALSHALAKQPKGDCGWTVPFVAPAPLGVGPLGKLGLDKASPLVVRSADVRIEQASMLKDVPHDVCDRKAFVGRRFVVLSGEEPGVLMSDLSVSLAAAFPSLGLDGSPYHWVFPGQSVTVAFPSAWPESAGAFQVGFSAVQLGDGPSIYAAIDGGEAQPSSVQGTRIESRFAQAAPTQPWTLHLVVPEDGSPTLLQGLSVGSGLVETWLVGAPNALITHRAVGSVRSKVRYEKPTPSVNPVGPLPMDDGTVLFETPSVSRLNDIFSWRASGLWGCSPVQVTRDGAPVGRPHQDCAELKTVGPGAYCHVGKKVVFNPLKDTDPLAEPDRWKVIVAPERKCGSLARWLFAGDTMTANPWRGDTAAMPAGVRSISVNAVVIEHDDKKRRIPSQGPEEPLVNMRLLHGDDEVLRHALRRSELMGETVSFPVDPPLVPGNKRIFFVFEAPAQGNHFVIRSASVSEKRVQDAAPVGTGKVP